jgi:hypothetical protein
MPPGEKELIFKRRDVKKQEITVQSERFPAFLFSYIYK